MKEERISYIFKQMKSKTVMVIGDIMLDHYIWGKVDRISPEAPVPVVNVCEESTRLGGAGNVANNLRSLGVNVILTGTMGTDRYGHSLMEAFFDAGISPQWIVTDPYRGTIVKTRIFAHTQQVVRMDRENKSLVTEGTRQQLVDVVTHNLDKLDAIIISDYAKGVISRELVADIVMLAWSKGIPVCVDPKDGNFPCYKCVDLITPNLKELSSGSGMKVESEEDLHKAAHKVLEDSDCQVLLVTRGEAGMSLFDRSSSIDIPTAARHVYDVTGAGDTVIACYTLAMVAGALPYEAAVIANKAAGIVVGEVGAASVTMDDLLKACLETEEE